MGDSKKLNWGKELTFLMIAFLLIIGITYLAFTFFRAPNVSQGALDAPLLLEKDTRECEEIPDYLHCSSRGELIINKKSANSSRVCYWNSRLEKCSSEKPLCLDEDDGLNYYERAKVFAFEQLDSDYTSHWYDYCGRNGEEEGKLVEYICVDEYYVSKYLYECPKGCSVGACIP